MKIITLLLFTGLAYFANVNAHPIVESCICPALYRPVCGSDGQIYNNACELGCENKRRQNIGIPQICNLGDYTGPPPKPLPNDDPCNCPKIYKPVCGSDGKIYDNDCLLDCENKRRQKLGLPLICNLGDYTGPPPKPLPNDDPCNCPKIYKPVCGSDGKIYDNDCLLDCENKRRQKLGLPLICNLGDYTGPPPKPLPNDDPCNCPKIYKPVCGSDGKIYDNDCLLDCENKRRQKLGLPLICNIGDYTGPPPKPLPNDDPCNCPKIYKPVCGSDGKIYDNDCLLDCENKRRQKLGLPLICNLGDYTGPPPKPLPNDDPCNCPKIYKPVCGSDGKIYDNDCLLNCENQRRQKLGLPLIFNLGDYTGPSPKPLPNEECICPALYRPVYGSDGNIYDNDCLLDCENKRRQKLGLPLIYNLGDYTGPHPKHFEECICPAIYRPVYGSDGNIYDNDCLLDCENKRRQKLGLPLIFNLGDYTGQPPKPSEECICPALYRPVYGSDGNIYDNDCLLDCENKRRQKLGLPLIWSLGDYTGQPPKPSEECICPALYRPVYGSDGKIYDNDCLLDCENKRRQKLGLPLIWSLGDYTGQPPKPSEECICPALYRPVYGSDGKIYDNDCLLDCENKRRQKLGLPLIWNLGDYTGVPPVVDNESCICPLLYRPVYGSDGKIYNNACELNCENKYRQNLGLPLIQNLGEYKTPQSS